MLVLVLAACGTAPSSDPTPLAPPTAGPSTDGASVAPTPAPEPAPPATATEEGEPEMPSGLPEGAACLDGSQCASGLCEGEGCDEASPGVCASAERACTRDLRPFCSCEDDTFQASGSCPGARYAYEGPCSEEELAD